MPKAKVRCRSAAAAASQSPSPCKGREDSKSMSGVPCLGSLCADRDPAVSGPARAPVRLNSPCTLPAACSGPVPEPPQPKTTGAAAPCDQPTLSFRRWSLSFAFRVMWTRTRLGAALSSFLHLSPGDCRSPSKSSSSAPLLRSFSEPRPASELTRPLTHRHPAHWVTTVALNMLHFGGRPPSPQMMRRLPNEAQSKALSYIVKLIRTCGAASEINIPAASRRSAQLVARLSEISEQFTLLGPSCDPYGPA